RRNDEIRIAKRLCLSSSLEHSDFIRHSSFVHRHCLSISFLRLSRGMVVDTVAVRLHRTDSRARTRKCKLLRRVSTRSKSHQPFRSISHIASRPTKDRLDDNGGVFPAGRARVLIARDRRLPGRARSRRPQDNSHRNRPTEKRARGRSLSGGRDSRWRAFSAGRGAASTGRGDSRAHRWRSDTAMRHPWQRSALFRKAVASAETHANLDRVWHSHLTLPRVAKIRGTRANWIRVGGRV